MISCLVQNNNSLQITDVSLADMLLSLILLWFMDLSRYAIINRPFPRSKTQIEIVVLECLLIYNDILCGWIDCLDL